jgi:hypothetical protein
VKIADTLEIILYTKLQAHLKMATPLNLLQITLFPLVAQLSITAIAQFSYNKKGSSIGPVTK